MTVYQNITPIKSKAQAANLIMAVRNIHQQNEFDKRAKSVDMSIRANRQSWTIPLLRCKK